ncbi:MAG: outer membrane beta-barrel protein [Aliarcobacter sp.]
MKLFFKLSLITIFLTTFLKADQVNYFHIGTSNAKIKNDTFTELGVGYGTSRYHDSIIVGVFFDFNYGNVKFQNKKDSVYTFSSDLKLGYAFLNRDFSVYALGAAALQSIGNIDGAGFGYGGGAEYKIAKNFALNFEYKKYDMTSNKEDYDYEKSNLYLKIIF